MGNTQSETHDTGGGVQEDLRASFIVSPAPTSQTHSRKKNEFKEEEITTTLQQCGIRLDRFDPSNPTGPVLVIRPVAEKDQVHQSLRESDCLPQNQLMVVLTTKSLKSYEGNLRLAVLKWEKDIKKFFRNPDLNKIQEFIRKCPPKDIRRTDEGRLGSNPDSSYNQNVAANSRNTTASETAGFSRKDSGSSSGNSEGVFLQPNAPAPRRPNTQGTLTTSYRANNLLSETPRVNQGGVSGALNHQAATQGFNQGAGSRTTDYHLQTRDSVQGASASSASQPFETQRSEPEASRGGAASQQGLFLLPDKVDYTWPRYDSVLEKAVQFVQTAGNIELVRSKNVHESSPLLLFCLNNGRLHEDIENAKQLTRSGKDVMLLVVTDKKDLRLVDTEKTQEFGNKARLCWDHDKKKIRFSENRNELLWIQKFLDKHGKALTIQFSRMDRLSRSASERIKGKASGVYRVVPTRPPDSENLLKNVIVYFNQKFIELNEDRQQSGTFVLLCLASKGFERDVSAYIRSQGNAEIIVIVLLRMYEERIVSRLEGREVACLYISDFQPEVMDKNENKLSVHKVKRFLNKHGKKEPSSQAGQSETGQQARDTTDSPSPRDTKDYPSTRDSFLTRDTINYLSTRDSSSTRDTGHQASAESRGGGASCSPALEACQQSSRSPPADEYDSLTDASYEHGYWQQPSDQYPKDTSGHHNGAHHLAFDYTGRVVPGSEHSATRGVSTESEDTAVQQRTFQADLAGRQLYHHESDRHPYQAHPPLADVYEGRQETEMDAEDSYPTGSSRLEQTAFDGRLYNRDRHENRQYQQEIDRTFQRPDELVASAYQTVAEPVDYHSTRYRHQTEYGHDTDSSLLPASEGSFSEAYYGENPHKPRSQRRRTKKPRDTILPEGGRDQSYRYEIPSST